MRTAGRLIAFVAATALMGAFMAAALPQRQDEIVRVPQAALPKGDRWVMMRIDDGYSRIVLGPMSREEADTYADAAPHVFRWGTPGYADALAQVRQAGTDHQEQPVVAATVP
jgi:hypothetical protein